MAQAKHVLKHLTLYYRPTCPFCVRVNFFTTKQKIIVNEKNISSDHKAHQELISKGGKRQVPALKIERKDGTSEWMYESGDIIRFLKQAKQDSAA